MNEWARTFSQKFNDILTSGYDSNGNEGIKMFTGKHASDEGQYEFPDGFRYDSDYVNRVVEANKAKYKEDNENTTVKDFVDQYMIDNPAATPEEVEKALDEFVEREVWVSLKINVNVSDDSYYRMTAMNFDILSAMEIDPSRLANRYDKGEGVEQNDLLEDIRDLATDKTRMSFRGSSATEFLQCILSDVALNSQRANTFYGSFRDIAGTIDTQRISISGVDEDEEAVNLVKYQNGYNLASKMIQTLTEIYDKLILETGV